MKTLFAAFLEFAVYVCISGVISNIVGYIIPRKSLNADAFPYKSYSWEKNGELYDVIKIKKWKNKVPDISKYVNFLYPKSMTLRPTAKQMDRLIKESCVAEAVHTLLIAASPLCYLSIDSGYACMFTVLYVLGNIPFIIIQRYNRPAFKRMYAALCEMENAKTADGGVTCESVDAVMQYRTRT